MKSIAIITKKDSDKYNKAFKSLYGYLVKMDKEVYITEELAESIGLKKYNQFIFKKSQVDLVIVMGGDGTILRTISKMKHVGNTRFFGINIGNLGFLSEIQPTGIQKTLKQIFAGKFSIDKRRMIKAEIKRDKKTVKELSALNDVVINNSDLGRLIRINTKVNGRKLTTYRGDGLIISTPTGSTAYSLSAGGPIVHPEVPAFIISPICSHSFSQKPVVIPDTKKIQISMEKDYDKVSLTVDGQETVRLKPKDEVMVYQEGEVCFVRLLSESYFQTLRDKLGWGD